MMRKKKAPTAILNVLYSDEQIVWADRPALLRPRHVSIFKIIFGCFWLGMIFFMQEQIADFGSGSRMFGRPSSFDSFRSIFTLVLFGFMFIGLGMIFHPVLHALKAWRTHYAITNHRALIVMDFIVYQHALAYSSGDLNEIRRSVHGDGTGDVYFASQEYTYTRHNDSHGLNVRFSSDEGVQVYGGKRRYTGTKRIGFHDVEGDETAANLLKHLKAGTLDETNAIDEEKLKRHQMHPPVPSTYANNGHFMERDKALAAPDKKKKQKPENEGNFFAGYKDRESFMAEMDRREQVAAESQTQHRRDRKKPKKDD